MKIERKDDNFCSFWEIVNGDVFIYQDDVYIKFDDTNDLNAVNLRMGSGDWFEPDYKVKKINATLIIE